LRINRCASDGLPLFGSDVGGLGLLQIPPTDLEQVEVIKGVASALYRAGALGGVVDLISRRPAKEPVAGRYVLTARMSATAKDENYLRGDVREHDIQDTFFAELAVRGTAPRQTWVAGVAFERSTLDPRDEPRFADQYNVSGVFVQDVQGPLSVTATLFRYEVHDPAVVDRTTHTLATLSQPTINTGVETVATIRRPPFSVTGLSKFGFVHRLAAQRARHHS
jgi:outer membrane receptor protein involved in Fe transport